MNLSRRFHGSQGCGRPLAFVLGAPGAPAVVNHLAARRAERRHPPEGSFIEVDGVRLYYSDVAQEAPLS
jgi:hypothetical protein